MVARRRRNRTGMGYANSFYVIYGRSVMGAQVLEVSLSGVGTVLRLSRKGCVVNGQMTKASNKWVRPPLEKKNTDPSENKKKPRRATRQKLSHGLARYPVQYNKRYCTTRFDVFVRRFPRLRWSPVISENVTAPKNCQLFIGARVVCRGIPYLVHLSYSPGIRKLCHF